VILQTAAKTQSEGGALVNRNWNDSAIETNGMGHHLETWERLRHEHSAWKSGGAITWTIDSVPNPDTVNLAVTAAKVYQLHIQDFEAKNTAGADNVHVVNDSGTPYTEITDFASLLTDIIGGDMSGRYFNLVVWGSISSGSEKEHLFVNLPGGSYNRQADAIADVSGFTVFDIPADFRGKAFLITRITLRHQAAASGTWTSIRETDLRGQVPNIVAGGGTAAITTEFADNQLKVFGDGDPTRVMRFEVDGIADSTTRTLTVQDADGTIALTADLHAQAHGTSEHTEGTAWRVTYQDASGDDVELILGANGTFFQSNGASAAPTFGALVQSDIPGHAAAQHTEGGNWKVIYTDASGDETELALGADGTFFQANGVAAAPTFAALVQTDIAGHGIAQHTEHANWKVVYTDGSGDEQELALGADGTFLQSGGASTLPEFTALVDGDIPATHSGSAHHAQSHTIVSHSTNPQFSDVFDFVGSIDTVTISSGTFNLPAAPFGLIEITGEGGVDDILTDILTNGGSTTLVPGTRIMLTNTAGDAITITHNGAVLILSTAADVVLDSDGVDCIVLEAITNAIWVERWRSASLMPVASLTVAGKVELATTTEINTGSDSTRAMPVDQYVASLRNVKFITIRLIAADTSVTADTTIGGDFVIPFTGTLLQSDTHKELLMAYNDTAGITGTMVVDIHKGGTTVMTTNKLDIEDGEKNTRDATTQPDLTTTAVTRGDIFTFDVDAIHSGTAAKGLVVAFAIRLT
jgi:hypothetical protein